MTVVGGQTQQQLPCTLRGLWTPPGQPAGCLAGNRVHLLQRPKQLGIPANLARWFPKSTPGLTSAERAGLWADPTASPQHGPRGGLQMQLNMPRSHLSEASASCRHMPASKHLYFKIQRPASTHHQPVQKTEGVEEACRHFQTTACFSAVRNV